MKQSDAQLALNFGGHDASSLHEIDRAGAGVVQQVRQGNAVEDSGRTAQLLSGVLRQAARGAEEAGTASRPAAEAVLAPSGYFAYPGQQETPEGRKRGFERCQHGCVVCRGLREL